MSDSGLSVRWVKDLLSDTPGDFQWLVDGLLLGGGTSLLIAKPKVGKSTLVRNLAVSVARRDSFLGFPVSGGPVIYLALEEHAAGVADHFRRLDVSDEEIAVHVGSAPVDDPIGALHDRIEQFGACLAIIDPILKFTRVRDGNDYATMSNVLEPLIEVARDTGCHILCVHHQGKADRGAVDATLGSTALAGAFDTILHLQRYEHGRRTLAATQRYGIDLETVELVMDQDSGQVTTTGPAAAAREESTERQLLALVADQALTLRELQLQLGGNRKVVQDLVYRLHGEGALERSGKGTRGDAHRYRTSPSQPASMLTSYFDPKEKQETAAPHTGKLDEDRLKWYQA